MPSSTVENYLKAIYLLEDERGGGAGAWISMGDLAGRMRVVPGTATSMVKSLHREKWLDYRPRTGVALTERGRRGALKVLRKHRILEMFLVRVLDLDWTEVHEEAELLEHGLTDKLVDRMDAFLGYPEVDPHGDPIPGPGGAIKERTTRTLDQVEEGQILEIAQILKQDGPFLDFLQDQGLVPGTRLVVRERQPLADVVEVEISPGENRSLGGSVAARIRVKPAP
ncbi:MAG: metal-dependent transcriptional regulator [Oceanipulchritudo sp.]